MTEAVTTRRHRGRIIAVANQKGGVGKTTTTINLGAAIAQAGLRCLLIDMDPQGNASTGLGSYLKDRTSTVYDALIGTRKIEDVIVPTTVQGLDLVPGSMDLAGLDAELREDPGKAVRLRSQLEAGGNDLAGRDYDFILVDCPPSLNLLTVNALASANAIIVPLQAEFFALEGLTQLLATIRQIQQGLNPSLRINGIVLTMYDHRNRLSRQVAEDVRDNLTEFVFQTMIPRNVRLSEAPSHGLPALVYDPTCAGSRAYLDLTLEFLQREGYTEDS